jgi:hypothetical protein
MSFKTFIYYCALCGGWAAFVAWCVAAGWGVEAKDETFAATARATTLIAGLLGLLVATAVGAMDALLNAVGTQRPQRVLVCMAVGLAGGLAGGFLGEVAHSAVGLPRVIGWILVGMAIGASVGVFDLLRAKAHKQDMGVPRKKTLNGVLGGFLGGLVGGLLCEFLVSHVRGLPRFTLASGLVTLGVCIGLLIGLAQVILKEAWLRVEAGFRPGRELILSKEETTIGRAESCDLGLFGDNVIERLHARILLKDNRYVLADAGTPGGTFLNGRQVDGPAPLRSGDTIRVGHSVLRFGERQKRTR